MAKGRRPKAAKLKILLGDEGHRAAGDNPAPRRAVPRCPPHLGKDAKAEWRRLAKELDALGLLTDLDRGALAAYCSAYGRWVEAEKNVALTGTVLKSAVGGFFQCPYLAVVNRALDQMARFGPLLGLDPASRSRLDADPHHGAAAPESVSGFARKRGGA